MAYAAVVSLLDILKQLLDSDEYPNPQIKSLYDKVWSLQSSLKKIFPVPKSIRSHINDCEIQIREAVYEAQDTIESLLINPSDKSDFLQDLTKIVEDVTEKAENMAASMADLLSENRHHNPPSESSSSDDANMEIVGQEKHLELLKYQLLRDKYERDVIPIIGMPGIGKTTLAKCLYDDAQVVSRFDIRAWISVSQEYDLVHLLLSLLSSIEGEKVDVSHLMDQSAGHKNLAVHLYQTLFGKSYLIVIDDIWDVEVWDEVNRFFPHQKTSSRIILTTTTTRVPESAGISNFMFQMPFLNDDESWILLQLVVFATVGSCSYQIEQLGKQIAKNCQGLPLAIIEIGKFLHDHNTVDKWKEVAENENPLILIQGDNTPIYKAVSRSYHHLPPHLKACFLYMGAFPLKSEISVRKLIKLWISEGLLEPNSRENAEECLSELASRSLVVLGERSSRPSRTKTCRFHLVYRNLCVGEAKHEKFFHVINKLLDSFPEGTSAQRRLCIHNNNVIGLKEVHTSMKSVSAARSLLFLGPKNHDFGLQVYLNYKLLKVLDGLKIRFYIFPENVLELVRLRYLAITYNGELPESISRLLNLQVLIVHPQYRIKRSDAPRYLPMAIWYLHQLRHLECVGFDLQDPSSAAKGINSDDSLILRNLLTLSGVSAHSCTQGILARMPGLIKLGIRIDSRHDGDETFSFSGDCTILHRLETFKWVFVNPCPESKAVFPSLAFSYSLGKLTLNGCGFRWEDMTYIGELPNLEALKLQCRAFRGPEWVTNAGEFPKLRFLLLEDLDLEQWEVGSDEHFPFLSHVIIRHCYTLKHIPYEFIYISALDVIEVVDCRPSLVESAQNLLQIVGNPPFRVPVLSSWSDKAGKS